jgi:hypothetical protein
VQFTRVLAVSVSLLGLCASGTASAAGASATVLSASFTTDGVNTALDPVNRLLSGAGSTYDKTLKMGVYHKQLILVADGLTRPTLTVNAAGGSSHVKGAFGVDTISAEGEAAVGGLRVMLAPYVLPGSDVLPLPYLQIVATRVQETAGYNFVAPSFTTVSGAGQFNALTITGSLVGGKTLKVTGAEKENTVLYQSATVTITLNRKIETALISCSPKCVATPYSVSTAGIDVALNKAKLGRHTVSGDITIAGGSAGQGQGL